MESWQLRICMLLQMSRSLITCPSITKQAGKAERSVKICTLSEHHRTHSQTKREVASCISLTSCCGGLCATHCDPWWKGSL